MPIERTEIYQKNEQGETVLIEVIETEIPEQVIIEQIASKEEQLLQIYAELEALKSLKQQ
jgi:ligand-binding SRPBCC domain-containing protein